MCAGREGREGREGVAHSEQHQVVEAVREIAFGRDPPRVPHIPAELVHACRE